jgi:hypothetical protein
MSSSCYKTHALEDFHFCLLTYKYVEQDYYGIIQYSIWPNLKNMERWSCFSARWSNIIGVLHRAMSPIQFVTVHSELIPSCCNEARASLDDGFLGQLLARLEAVWLTGTVRDFKTFETDQNSHPKRPCQLIRQKSAQNLKRRTNNLRVVGDNGGPWP